MATLTTTQRNFNRFIRLRDSDDYGYARCITCNKSIKFGDEEYQAGHYYASGKYKNLTFNEDNVHGQCKQCNYFLSANLIEYRENLIKKIGQERFDLLSSQAHLHKAKKYYGFELDEINKKYLKKCRDFLSQKMF